ncbi:MAG: hypothetical protein M1821_000142 [Bathelium mastoideum]|nr:MAG: hypothetical protein M1821_000142 [Bathelium mastoideum]
MKIDRGKDVSEVLRDDGFELRGIESVIWSHQHFDHTGSPSGFHLTTVLVVGEGFKQKYLPGYPADRNSAILESDYSARDVREIKFSIESRGLEIGGMEAIDYFHDGSFYLLHAPGHAVGHVVGLARTTASPPTFILMGADTAHHGGEFRPSPEVSLPDELHPSPLGPDCHLNITSGVCPGSLFVDRVHPYHSATQPFYELPDYPDGKGPNEDIHEAKRSVEKMQQFDADDNVLVVIAHDASLLDVLEYWPQAANDWKVKGWKEKGRWNFLKDFAQAVEEKN